MGAEHHSTSIGPRNDGISMTDVRPLLELLENEDLSEMYTHLVDRPMTVPELVVALEVSKSTAYKYVEKLLAAGLVSAVGEEDGATLYESTHFEIVVNIAGETLRLTPDLIRVISRRDSSDTIDRFIEQYGVVTLAEALDLTPSYADGELTHRIVAAKLEIPHGWAFDILAETLPIVDDLPESDTISPDDVDDGERAALLDDDSDSSA